MELIIFLASLSVILILVEILFIPGTTVVGIIGGLIGIASVYLAYKEWGALGGSILLISGAVFLLLVLYFSIKFKLWDKFAMKEEITTKVNEGLYDGFQLGDIGVTTSVLRPMGKVDFSGKEIEVSTLGGYCDAGVKVKIINIAQAKIIVEQINS